MIRHLIRETRAPLPDGHPVTQLIPTLVCDMAVVS